MSDTILLVEPNVSDQRMVEMTLAAEFLEVASVTDGTQALEQLAVSSPALVITDMELPDLSAADLIRQAKSRAPALRVLLLGSDPEALARAVQELGADEVLGKPFKSKDLLDRVYRLMRGEDSSDLPAPAAEDGLGAAPFASEEGNFDLAGALDTLGDGGFDLDPEPAAPAPPPAAAAASVVEGIENTVVMRRDDLGALRSGLGVSPRGPLPAAPSSDIAGGDEATGDAGADGAVDLAGDEVDGFQTMIMSRDELSALRSRAESKGKSGAAKKPTPAAAPAPKARMATPAPARAHAAAGKPGSRDAVEAIVRDAATATEQELLTMLGKLDPAMSSQVRQVTSELVKRVARRVATDVAATRVDEEIARLRRSLGEP